MNATTTYRAAVQRYRDYLLSHPEALKTLEALVNQRGHEYFSKETGHMWAPYRDVELELKKEKNGTPKLELLTRTQFAKEADETGIWQNEAAFDDSFRHTIFIDITNLESPTLVDPPKELLSSKTDWILTWEKVEQLPTFYPDGTIIAVHTDVGDGGYIFFPVPSATIGGRRKRGRKTKRAKRT